MRKLVILSLCWSVIMFLTYSSQAQHHRSCSTMDHLHLQEQQDPQLTINMESIELFTQQWITNHPDETGSRTVYTIPVVVHVLYNTSAQNISDAQIQSQLEVLNRDFRRLNTDASNTLSQFQSIAADSEINFCLASVDPDGNSTNGITRTYTNLTSFSYDNKVKYTSQGGKDAWHRESYLNIWVCNLSNLLGYAQFPGGNAATDGVVVNFMAFGTIGTASSPFHLGRTATHEVGHWLNLRHIWGDGNCSYDDGVADTPPATAANYGCPLSRVSCNSLDMVQNYMDYTNDACMNVFTLGQKSRMRAQLAPGGFRHSLLSSNGCNAPAPPTCSTPGSLNVSNITTSSANLSWNAVNGASSYQARIKSVASSSWTTYNTTSTSLSLSVFTASTQYEFQVRTVCVSSSSNYSTSFNFTTGSACSPPTVLSASNIVSPSATLSWNTVSGASSYLMRIRRVATNSWSYYSTTNTVYTLNSLQNGTQYEFQVRSNCGAVKSSYSVSFYFSTGAVCNLPTSLSASTITSSSALLTWSDVNGAVNYNLRVRRNGTVNWLTLNSASSSINVTGLLESTNYEFQVQSDCGFEMSNFSGSSYFTTLSNPLHTEPTCDDIHEPNETSGSSKSIGSNTNIQAQIATVTDVDFYRFGTQSSRRNIRITLEDLPADYDIELYNSKGQLVAHSYNRGTANESIVLNQNSLGSFFIKVFGYQGAFSNTHCYNLFLELSGNAFRGFGSEIFTYHAEENLISQLYPNPASDFIMVEFESIMNTDVSIMMTDITGRQLSLEYNAVQEGNNLLKLSTSKLSPGLYFLQINDGMQLHQQRFVISR